MNKYVEFIREKLDSRDLLEQLAEESAEFTQSILKLIRASGWSDNVTPITFNEAKDNFLEEWKDMLLVLYILEISEDETMLDNPKLKRWAERLGYEDE